MTPSIENEELLKLIQPYLQRIIENRPQYGSAGLTLIFCDGQLSRVDISESVQRKIVSHAAREGGRP
mgnify:CR=1 FL=1|jgi:hypothetical protein